MSVFKNNESFMSRSLEDSSILNVQNQSSNSPSYRDILNAQILLHSATDDIATELSNRYLKKITGKNYFNTGFKEIETKYLILELSDRVMTLQKLLLSLD